MANITDKEVADLRNCFDKLVIALFDKKILTGKEVAEIQKGK